VRFRAPLQCSDAVAFKSYWLPLLIAAIPFGFMGAIWICLAFGINRHCFPIILVSAPRLVVVVFDNLVFW
jgi:hypothetical protein